MKLTNILLCGILLLTGGLTTHAQEVTAQVKANSVNCDKVILSHAEDDKLVAQFLVHDMPEYNSYIGIVGDSALNQEKTHLRAISGHLASWLIIVDVSDPSGRTHTILQSAALATRLVTLMSEQSNANILSLAGGLNVAANSETLKNIMSGGSLNEVPIMSTGKNGISFGHDLFGQIIGSVVDGNQTSNTNLWLGVTRALNSHMDQCASGIYRNLPRGIILISDGVDESSTTHNDFDELVQLSKKMSVPVHTIAMPFKDKPSKKVSKTQIHQGFGPMQKLAMSTGGSYLNYEDLPSADDGHSIAKLDNMLSQTAARILLLTTEIDDVPAAASLRVKLRNGSDNVGFLEVDQKDVGRIVADNALHTMYKVKMAMDATDDESDRSKGLAIMQNILFKRLLLCKIDRNAMLELTHVNRDFAARVCTLLAHLDKDETLLKKDGIELECIQYILNNSTTLPQHNKEETNIVVNNQSSPQVYTNTSNSGSGQGEMQDWVWWALGISGSCALVVIFVLLIRSLSKGDDEDEDDGNSHTAPILATLVDLNNPSNSWDVTKASCTVGRSASADITVPSAHISSLHFALTRHSDGSWTIKDANSTNGTVVNGKSIHETTPLANGDTITIGDKQLAFRTR